MPSSRVPVAVAVGLLTLVVSATAQPLGAVAEVEGLSAALRADQQAHLWRVGAWGLANVVGGTALVLVSDRDAQPGRWAFGLQSGAWGAVNIGIAAVGLAMGPGEATGEWPAALAAENGYADVLLVNLGLNVGYAAVGTTLLAVAGRGVTNPDAWRGHGSALILQGAGLFALDGVAYFASRGRFDALVEAARRSSLSASASGLTLIVPL